MVTFIVRGEAEALRAASALVDMAPDAMEVPDVRFERYPMIAVTVPEGIGVESGRTLSTLEKIVRTQFSLIKYSTPDLRKLTAEDKAAVKLGVEFPHRTQMVVDFSRAATALVRAVQNRVAEGGKGEFQQQQKQNDIFAKPPAAEPEPIVTWPAAAAATSLAVVRKLSPVGVACLAVSAIIVAGVSYSAPTAWGHYLKYRLEQQARFDARQERFAKLERTTIVPKSGQVIAPAANRAADRELAYDSDRVRALVSFHREGPFSRFVQLVDHARPAILDLAQSTTIDINGLTVSSPNAKTAAKAIRKDTSGGWTAIVKIADTDGSWKATVRPEEA